MKKNIKLLNGGEYCYIRDGIESWNIINLCNSRGDGSWKDLKRGKRGLLEFNKNAIIIKPNNK